MRRSSYFFYGVHHSNPHIMIEFLSPAHARAIDDPNKKVFCTLAIRQLWHLLFDHSNAMHDLLGEKQQSELFEKFLADYVHVDAKVSWHMPIRFLSFMNSCNYYNERIARDLVTSEIYQSPALLFSSLKGHSFDE